MTTDAILDQLREMYPDAGCELDYRNLYELLAAVMLSAQTTDKAVNKATKGLFQAYPDLNALAQADPRDVERYIRSIGLYHNKAANLVRMARQLVAEQGGQVPRRFAELTKLPGVGRKTANVVLAEGYQIPALPVDTHVERVAKRLGLARLGADVLGTEKALCRKIAKERWIEAHHLFIFFGRYRCKSQAPSCAGCPFSGFCKFKKKLR